MNIVSIVIPVYNVESYINRCIESVLYQTYSEMQIIIIDDGSTDNSLFICQEYAKKDNRIEVIHQENKGVSAARNIGLHACVGEYVFFVDADDYLLPQYIEHFMEYPDEDFIGGGYVDNNGWKCQFSDLEVSVDDFRRSYGFSSQNVPFVHVHGNRYKREVIEDNSLEFEAGVSCGEDSRFNMNYFKTIDRLCVTSRCEYCYTVRQGSLVNRFIYDRLTIEREECQLKEVFFYPSEDSKIIMYTHWHTVLEPYYSYLNDLQNKISAKKALKMAIQDSYFRKCLPYLIKSGTKDMKLEGLGLLLYSYRFYKCGLRLLQLFKSK